MTLSGTVKWDTGAAAHLLRRAAFGGTPEDASSLASRGLQGAVDFLLGSVAEAPPPPATDPGEMAARRNFFRLRKQNEGRRSEEEADFQRDQRRMLSEMRYWWLRRMHADAGAAREKLTLFWHGHFATSHAKVRLNHLMLVQNQTLRRLGMAPFRELCTAMACDPAMLVWLDGRGSRAEAPNENFAREIMELFALGEGHYSEEDIREAARAFTGWSLEPSDATAVFRTRRFDDGTKTIFGQRGRFGAEEAVGVICSQPACADFLSAKIWEFYAGSPPPPALAASLASYYRGKDLDTGALLRSIFTRPEFYAETVRGRQVKSPVQWMVQSSRELGRQLLPEKLALPLASSLGQNLFEPPSVKGWAGGPAWINSATLIRRSNTARTLAVAAPPLPRTEVDSMNSAAWAFVAPAEDRADAARLSARLAKVLLATEPSAPTRHKLDELFASADFPCGDETVREAAVILLSSPEYQLC